MRQLGGVRTKVLLVDPAPVIHNEGHNTALAIRRGPGNEGEAGDHVSVDDITVFAAGRVFALAGKNLEKVTVEWFLSRLQALCLGVGHERTERTDFAVRVRRPIRTIFGVWRADKLLREFKDVIAVVAGRILPLGLDTRAQGLEGGQFVLANAAVENLLSAGRCVKKLLVICKITAISGSG